MPVLFGSNPTGLTPMRTITRGPRTGQEVPLYQVRFPGWDDIVHLVPTASLTPEEIRARQLRQITDFQNSPTPEIAQHFADLATQVDNVQDALVVLSVLGRVATKVVGRAIPGVGAIATAADVLNAVNIFYPPLPGIHSLPSVAGIRSAAGRLTKYARSLEHKREISLRSALGTGAYAQRLEETLKTGKIGFGWGEALQALQVTDSMYGFGLSLGPIFGALTDTMFGLLRGARFDVSGPLQFAGEAVAPLNQLLIAPFLGERFDLQHSYQAASNIHLSLDVPGLLTVNDWIERQPAGTTEAAITKVLAPLADPVDYAVAKAANAVGAVYNAGVWAAKKVFSAGAWLAGVRGDLPWEDHVELLTAQYLALQHVGPLLQQFDWGVPARAVALKPHVLESIPFVDRQSWGNLGGLSEALREGPAQKPLDWVDEAPSAEARVFTQSLLSSYADLQYQSLEGPGARVFSRSSDAARALLAMHEHDLLPPFDRSRSQLATYIARVSDLVREADSVFPPRAAMLNAFFMSFQRAEVF
jgi:hypothetical protein